MMGQRLQIGSLGLGSILVLCPLSSHAFLTGSHPQPRDPYQAIRTPIDRAADTREIYSTLLRQADYPSAASLPQPAPELRLLTEFTSYIEPGQPCVGLERVIKPPKNREADFHQLLLDFSQHCRDLIDLSEADFDSDVHLRLLDEAAEQRFWKDQDHFSHAYRNSLAWAQGKRPIQPDQEFAAGYGLSTLSEVFFNKHHTVAMVAYSLHCGGTCGHAYWTVLGRRHGVWHILPWQVVNAIY